MRSRASASVARTRRASLRLRCNVSLHRSRYGGFSRLASPSSALSRPKTLLPQWRGSTPWLQLLKRALLFLLLLSRSLTRATSPFSEGHHPDLHLESYRCVRCVLTTHAVGGLTLPDFILAAKLDELPVEYSPKWAQQQGIA